MLASQKLKKQPKLTLTSKQKTIQHAGGRFAFAHELWIDCVMLNKLCPPRVIIIYPSHYDDEQIQKLTALAKLYKSLSLDLRVAISMLSCREGFKKLVSHNFSQHISS